MPDFDEHGNLPPGIHPMTWQEFTTRFGTNPYRRGLLAGLKEAIELIKRAGCQTVYLNGSFVTSKALPGDFDMCWDEQGVSVQFLYQLAPVLFDVTDERAAQKARFGGEIFPSHAVEVRSGEPFIDFFRRDKNGQPKGIVSLDLKGFPS